MGDNLPSRLCPGGGGGGGGGGGQNLRGDRICSDSARLPATSTVNSTHLLYRLVICIE